MPDLPDAAITAAAEAIEQALRSLDNITHTAVSWHDLASIAVEAAAPALRAQGAAAEREACAQLAEQVNARYVTHELPDHTTSARQPVMHPFARLIRARTTP